MASNQKYQKRVKDIVLGEEKLITAQTEEELNAKVERQYQIWNLRVEHYTNEQVAQVKTQEIRELSHRLATLLKRKVCLERKPGWKRNGSSPFVYPPFLFEPTAPTYYESACLFPMPEFHPLFPALMQTKVKQQRIEAFANIHRYFEQAQAAYEERKAQAFNEYKSQHKRYNEQVDDKDAIMWVLNHILTDLNFPCGYGTEFLVGFEQEDREVVLLMDLPRIDQVPTASGYRYSKERKEVVPISLKKSEVQNTYEKLLAQIALATMFDVFHYATTPRIQSIVFNGFLGGIHPATGNHRKTCVLTVQATRDDLEVRNLEQVDAVHCLRDLRGLTAGPLADFSPVQPIRILHTHDERFVDTENILAHYPSVLNIATMPWRDFEHMVTELFQKIFAGPDNQVRLTRSRADRGVDAIIFDADIMRGGKTFVQAKQYPGRLVTPAHVRELIGSMTVEKATRGFLVTTGRFSQESERLATDNNIVLFDGPKLLQTLHDHGFTYTSYQI